MAMIVVRTWGPDELMAHLGARAARYGLPWTFVAIGEQISRRRQITLSTPHVLNVARSCGAPDSAIALLCAAAGVLQVHALQTNEHLRPEDFAHDSAPHCLFANGITAEPAPVRFARPIVCAGCRCFYESLCGRELVEALNTVVWEVNALVVQRPAATAMERVTPDADTRKRRDPGRRAWN